MSVTVFSTAGCVSLAWGFEVVGVAETVVVLAVLVAWAPFLGSPPRHLRHRHAACEPRLRVVRECAVAWDQARLGSDPEEHGLVFVSLPAGRVDPEVEGAAVLALGQGTVGLPRGAVVGVEDVHGLRGAVSASDVPSLVSLGTDYLLDVVRVDEVSHDPPRPPR